jgi:hypothetical protein
LNETTQKIYIGAETQKPALGSLRAGFGLHSGGSRFLLLLAELDPEPPIIWLPSGLNITVHESFFEFVEN